MDRLVVKREINQRLTDSIETAAALSGGLIIVNVLGEEEQDLLFSQNYACEDCGISIEELTPRMFFLQQSLTALAPPVQDWAFSCGRIRISSCRTRAFPFWMGLSLLPGWNNIRGDGISRMYFEALAKSTISPLTTPFGELSKEVQRIILRHRWGKTEAAL